MKVWKNTSTLDAFAPELADCVGEHEAEVALIGGKTLDLSKMPHLKGVFRCGVGSENVPFEECEKRGVCVGLPSEETKNIIFEETAVFAVGLIYRMLFASVGDLNAWKKNARVATKRKKVLIVGRGNIGRRVEQALAGMVETMVYDVLDDEKDVFEKQLGEADVVTLHIPLTSDNQGFIGADQLALMKDGAALVNTARGPIVDEDALEAELSAGRIRAAFDVFWKEPYRGKLAAYHPDPFFMTPHVASTCADFLEKLTEDFREFRDSFEQC
ncbi:MAG: NAD(P)-dependent oxidoreductase [Verrucomicrobiota bacterium]